MKNLKNAELRALLERMGACQESLKLLGFERDLRTALAEVEESAWINWFIDVGNWCRTEGTILGATYPELDGLPDVNTYYNAVTPARENRNKALNETQRQFYVLLDQCDDDWEREMRGLTDEESKQHAFETYQERRRAAGGFCTLGANRANADYLAVLRAQFVIED